jgi:glutamate N-acetyltransferase/amino-acid N-acetyltransferase
VAFDPEGVDLDLGEVRVVSGGAACRYEEKHARAAAAAPEVHVTLDLNAGKCEARMWTCDLTAEYVRINSEYHT